MEAKTNAFFALRERLYAAAAAGCSVIGEDFRLKRAIEAFQPLSAANPVFAKLYGMCQKLTETDQPALLLCECIALADAVAVTQSRFQVDAPAKDDMLLPPFPVKQISWQQFQKAKRKVENGPVDSLLSPAFRDTIQDPRILQHYLKCSGTKTERADQLSLLFEQTYGEALIPLLEEAIDTENPRSTGQQIVYLKRLGGSRLNDLFIRYAEDHDMPQDVRIRAMEALADDPENADTLLRVYQTEKGKVKTAALKCLVQTNSPLADTVLEKVFAKPKDSNYAIAGLGNTPLCNAFAEETVRGFFADLKQKQGIASDVIRTLANKPDAGPLFLRMADYLTSDKPVNGTQYFCLPIMNRILIENICRHEDPVFQALICQLHYKKPAVFFKPRLCLALLNDPENALIQFEAECRERVGDTIELLNCIRRSPDLKWRLTPSFWESPSTCSLVLFEHLPRSLTDFVGSCCRMPKACDSWKTLIPLGEALLAGCADDERSRTEHAVREMSAQLLENGQAYITTVFRLYTAAHGDPKGMIVKHVMGHMKQEDKPVRYYALLSCTDFMPDETVRAELQELAELLPKQKGLPAAQVKAQLGEVEEALKRIIK